MTQAHNTRGAVNGRAIIIAVTPLRFAAVQAHAHADCIWADFRPGIFLQLALRLEGGGKGIGGGVECSVYAIARGFDHDAPAIGDSLPQEGVMPGLCRAHLFTMPVPKQGALLNVSKKERDSPAGPIVAARWRIQMSRNCLFVFAPKSGDGFK